MSRLPRYPQDKPATGKDLNLILAILDTGGVVNSASTTSSGVTGDSLSPFIPNVSGSVSPNPGDTGAPVTPRGFTGTSGIDNFAQAHTAYVLLSWTPNPIVDFVSRYDIYYHKGTDQNLYNLSVGGDVSSIRVNNLFPGNTYSFAIQAHDAANRSSLWTPEITINISLDSDSPAIPSGLTATGTTRGAYLTWTEVGSEGISDDLKQYQIAVSLDGGATYPTTQTIGPGNSFFYVYTPTNPSTAQAVVFFKIATSDWTGNVSDFSTPVSATVGGIDASEITGGTITGPIVITNLLQVNSTILSLARITGASLQTNQNLIMNATNPSIVGGTASLRFRDNANANTTLLLPDNGQAVFRNGLALLGGAVDVGAGVLNYTQVTSTAGGFTTSLDVVTSSAVTVTSGRRIRVTASADFSDGTGSDGASVLLELIETGTGTVLQATGIVLPATSGQSAGGVVCAILTPSAGSHTYKLTGVRASGAGTITHQAAATFPTFILVEDIGT